MACSLQLLLCLGLTLWLCFTNTPLPAGDIFLEKAIEHSLHRTYNQIGSVGNTKVAEWVKGSIHQQFYKIRNAVRGAGGDIHGCIFRGTGHLYIPSEPDMPELVGGRLTCVGASGCFYMLVRGSAHDVLRCICPQADEQCCSAKGSFSCHSHPHLHSRTPLLHVT